MRWNWIPFSIVGSNAKHNSISINILIHFDICHSVQINVIPYKIDFAELFDVWFEIRYEISLAQKWKQRTEDTETKANK